MIPNIFKRLRALLGKKSTHIYTNSLNSVELCVFEEMVKHEVSRFTLRYRFSHYDKEEYIVYLSHNIFDPLVVDACPYIDIQILIKNEAGQIQPFAQYVEERNGNIFNHHNWDMLDKYIIQEHCKGITT